MGYVNHRAEENKTKNEKKIMTAEWGVSVTFLNRPFYTS
jgi:hypothetical protein